MSTSKQTDRRGAESALETVRLTINGRSVECPSNTSIIEAATSLGIEIPTLCYLPELPVQTSCFMCVVELDGVNDLSPACSTRVAEGMVIQTDSPKVVSARKTCLELLLSDHAGSCVGTCTTACPADMEIASFLDQVEIGEHREALRIVRQALPIPAILGRVCAGHCESACLRKDVDEAVSVRSMHGWLAEEDMAGATPYVPACKPPTGKRVAIVGAGPAGLSAAYTLLQEGHACTLFDTNEEPGGLLRYGMPDDLLDKALVDAETAIIFEMGAEFRGQWRLGRDGTLTELVEAYDAVVLAIGATIDWTTEARTIDLDFVRTMDVRTLAMPLSIVSSKKGIAVDRPTGATNVPGVYAAGEVVSGKSTTIQSVASGRRAAEAICAQLAGHPTRLRNRWYFRSKMTEAERTTLFSRGALVEDRPRLHLGVLQNDTAQKDVREEAKRCLDCACVSLHNCKLRDYSVQYNAVPNRYPGGARRELAPDYSHPLVNYEPGKCILCGLCVAVAEEAGEEVGLAFAGRGFETRVGVPFDDAIRRGIEISARRCAEVCPSGAITLKLDRK